MAKDKAQQEKRERGRPSKFTPEIGAQICQYILDGLTLRQIGEIEGMPSKSVILSWYISTDKKFADFQDQYARARVAQVWGWADEITEISDDGRNDWMEREGRNGETFEVVNHEAINRSRLRVDTRKWLMSKFLPKVFGDSETKEDENKKPQRRLVYEDWGE